MSEIKNDDTLCLRDLYTFLVDQPEIVLKRLYEQPLTCLAVFRTLPPLGKLYVQRLLFITAPVPKGDVLLWARNLEMHEYVGCVPIENRIFKCHLVFKLNYKSMI